MIKTVFTLTAATLLLSGCMSLAPQYQAPVLPVADQLGTELGADFSAESYQLQWQDFVLEAQLKQLLGLAMEHNRDRHIALATIEKYRALYQVERSAYLPTLGVEGSANHQRLPADLNASSQAQTAHQYQVGGVAQFELDFFGRIRNLSEAALNRYLMTEAAGKTVESLLVRDVTQAYALYQAAWQQRDLSQKTWLARQTDHQLQQQRYELGLITELALQQSAQSYAQARVDYEQTQVTKKQSFNALQFLVGTHSIDDLLAVDMTEQWFVGKEFHSSLPSSVLLARPDVQEMEYQLIAAHADIGAARAAFFPRISLMGSAGTASADLQDLFSGGSGTWSFMPSITIPIFTAGRNKALLKAATADQKIALAEYEKKIQIAFKEVVDQLAVQEHITIQLTAQTDSYVAAQKMLDLAQQRYDLGADGYLQVLDAQRVLYSSQKSLIDIALAKQMTISQLYAALGG